MNKKVFSLLLSFVLVFGSVVSAAPFDLIHKTDPTRNYTFNEFEGVGANFDYVSDNLPSYIIESVDGKYYNVNEVNDRLNAGAKDLKEAIEGLEPVERPERLEVVGISAINSTQAEIKFNREVMKPVLSQFSATDKTQGSLAYFNKVELGKDKKSVILTFPGKFKDKHEYEVKIRDIVDAKNGDLVSATKEFEYLAADVQNITFTKDIIAEGQNLRSIIKVTDGQKRDVTSEVSSDIEFHSTEGGFIDEDGKVIAGNNKVSYIIAKVVVEGKVLAETGLTKVTVKNPKVKDFVGFYLYEDGKEYPESTEAFEKLNAKDKEKGQTVTVDEKKNLALYYKDQNGNSMPVVSKTDNVVNFEETKAIIVRANDGTVTIRGAVAGQAVFNIVKGELENTLQVEVRDIPVATEMDLDETSVSLKKPNGTPELNTATVKIDYTDQFGDEFEGTATGLEVKSANGSIATVNKASDNRSFVITAVAKGKTTVDVEFTRDDGRVLAQQVSVDVYEANDSDFAGYRVYVDNPILDLKEEDTKKAQIKVYTVNADGQRIREADEVTFESKDTSVVKVDNDGKVTAGNKGSADVSVKINNVEFEKVNFTVVDTTPVPHSAELNKTEIVVTKDSQIKEALKDITVVKGSNGEEITLTAAMKDDLDYRTSGTVVDGEIVVREVRYKNKPLQFTPVNVEITE